MSVRVRVGDDATAAGLPSYDITPHLKRVNLKKFPPGTIVWIGPRGGVHKVRLGQTPDGVVQDDGTIAVSLSVNYKREP